MNYFIRVEKKLLFIALFSACFSIEALTATTDSPALSADSALTSASRALEEGLFQVAEQKCRAILSGSGRLSPETRNAATSKLAESLIEQRQGEDALKVMESSHSPDTSEIRFLRARAFVCLGKWAEALSLFEGCADDGEGKPFAVAAACGRAECLQALGRTQEALSVLESIKHPSPVVRFRLVELAVAAGDLKRAQTDLAAFPPSGTGGGKEQRWRKYLEARVLLADGKAEQATDGFEAMIKSPQGLPEGVFVAATLGLTEARIVTGGLENADNVLEDFIWQHPTSAYLETMFRRLDQIYSLEENASDSELEKWLEKGPPRRAALSLYYFACMEMREGKEDHALKKFQNFARLYPDNALSAQADYNAGKILSKNQKLDAALSCFESAMRFSKDAEFLAEVEMTAGIAEFQKKDFVLASSRFRSAAGHSARLWQQATFNSGLAWLNQGNYDKFLEEYKEISRRFPDSAFRPEMLLEEGLLQARLGDPKAKGALALFVKDFPKHPRAVEAQLALAELAFADSDLPSSGKYLKATLESPSSPQTAEQAALLAIFQADSPIQGSKGDWHDNARVLDLCTKFLGEHPGSEMSDQVRMKLGQVYFRSEDYANAQTQFETLARENPASPLSEPALFLAGQSSMRSMNTGEVDHAIEIFQQVAEAKGALQLHARQQQAIAYTRLGKDREAVILYDEILGASPPADLRFAVLCGKGDSLLTSAGKDEKLLGQVIAVFNQLAEQPDVTASWRNQALYKKAKCLEALSRPTDALSVYYDILQAPAVPGREGPDYTWFYKAGFDAAGALETQEQWKPAIVIYEKLANLLGPRSDEAKKRGDQLRLEHFIWEE